jgi:hypothetical protein
LLVVATAVLIRGAGDRIAEALGLSADAMFAAAHAVVVLHLRAIPVLLSAAVVVISLRQRSRLSWPFAGTAVVCLIAGTFSIQVFGDQLGVSSSLLPYIGPLTDVFGPTSTKALVEGLTRTLLMLMAAWSPWLVWFARVRAEHSY